MSGPSLRHLFVPVAVVCVALVGAACSGDDGDAGASSTSPSSTVADGEETVDDLRLNEIQMIGSHNSYKERPREELANALGALVPNLFAEIDYGHLPLGEQLADHGIRQLEIDVFADPDGGLYSTPAALEILGIEEDPDPALLEPGFKVQHIQDVDFETTCPTFVACLEEVEQWSSANPDHLPIMVMVETKSGGLADGAQGLGVDLSGFDAEFATPPEMTPELFEALEAEVLEVFPRDQLITPDDVRGDAESLEAAVLEKGWPTVGESRGKVLFSLVDTGAAKDVYTAETPSLEGRLFFTSGTPGEPDAAFVRVDDSITDGADLERFARDGYLIRTRTDSPGVHAPANDTSWRDSALASGAHYLSTDYYVADPALGTGFVVALPGGAVARCNPLTAPGWCSEDLFVTEG